MDGGLVGHLARVPARRNGYEVGDRGRVPVHIVEKYHATAGRRPHRKPAGIRRR
jgi:hypothetical protein